MRKIVPFIVLFCLLSCGQGVESVPDKAEKNHVLEKPEPFELIVEKHSSFLPHTTMYILTEKDIHIVGRCNIVFAGAPEDKSIDTAYYAPLMPSGILTELASVDLDSLDTYYQSKCIIIGGNQLTVHFRKGNRYKRVHLSNYYCTEVGEIIEMVNAVTPNEYKIWYGKKELEEWMHECP